MKTITFRPLRLHKKSGKIIVASYLGWNKVRCADYDKFNLIIDDEYKRFDDESYVYNHELKQLFFQDFDPSQIPIHNEAKEDWQEFRAKGHKRYGCQYGEHISYVAQGMDCCGTPTFSHQTADQIANNARTDEYLMSFEPLTVKTVKFWFGWWLYQLQNNTLQIGK